MSLSEDEEKTSASGEFIIDYGHRSLTGQKGKGGVDEWLKKYHKFTYIYKFAILCNRYRFNK